ncbi:MAG: F-type H+-transporting ATPase subunit b [Gammaproteobacteria bacterium]|nr:MAG: F-type H+-transporting ATPase subunit b [Gammaproteobacteria bacterium]TND02495.1 MAG: F-type H+-transporting ATPase subunit b [Gammaproteobacteria bacterium]
MNITVSLFGQVLAFVLLIWFVNRVLWGPLSAMMAERQKRIADGLAAADKGRHELELAEKRAKEVLKDTKAQAAEILAQAEKRASEIAEEGKANARIEGERLLKAARAEIDQEANRAKEHLRGQVALLATAGAGKILRREVDARAHADLMKDLIAQI